MGRKEERVNKIVFKKNMHNIHQDNDLVDGEKCEEGCAIFRDHFEIGEVGGMAQQ